MDDRIYLACYNIFDSGIEKQKIVFTSFSEDKVKKWVDKFNDTKKRYGELTDISDNVSSAYYLEINVE